MLLCVVVTNFPDGAPRPVTLRAARYAGGYGGHYGGHGGYGGYGGRGYLGAAAYGHGGYAGAGYAGHGYAGAGYLRGTVQHDSGNDFPLTTGEGIVNIDNTLYLLLVLPC